jgi:hypothetical protein
MMLNQDMLSTAVSDRRSRFEQEAANARMARRSGSPSRWRRWPSRSQVGRAATAQTS